MKQQITAALGAMVFTLSLSALAQTPPSAPPAPSGPPPKSVPLALASEMALSASETCVAKGYNVSVAVVDSAGDLTITLRSDGARARLLDFSRRKAFTSAASKRKTSELLEISKQDAKSPELPTGDNIILLSGGVPILVNGELIGAIGVGGAPAGPTDEQCAEAGIAKVRERLK